MAVTLYTFDTHIAGKDGFVYQARACGYEREDGLWDGWLEFERTDGLVLRSARETTQPNLVDLDYWAKGLTPVYLDGALARTLEPFSPPVPEPLPPPAYQSPAPTGGAVASNEAILESHSVYRNVGPELLMQELSAMRGWHLRQIIRAYRLADAHTNLDALTELELANLIVQRVAADFLQQAREHAIPK